MAIAFTTATHGAHRGLPAPARTLVAGMVAVLVAIAPEQVAAASNALSAGKVMPASGTTQTSFTLSVGYLSPHGVPATRVVALVANRTIEMALFSGRSDDGVWEASARLPAGTWPVTFQATAAQGKNPTLAGPTLVVAAAPSPTAPPTPAAPPATAPPQPIPPEPAPPAPPAPPAAPAAPPAASLVTAPPASPLTIAAPQPAGPGAVEAQPSAGASELAPATAGKPDGDLLPAPSIDGFSGAPPLSLLLIAVAGLGAFVGGSRLVAFARHRRRREPALELAPAAAAAGAAGPTVRPARRPAEWELASLDDEPIGTVDYLGLQP